MSRARLEPAARWELVRARSISINGPQAAKFTVSASPFTLSASSSAVSVKSAQAVGVLVHMVGGLLYQVAVKREEG
jgi:hypothetical protein